MLESKKDFCSIFHSPMQKKLEKEKKKERKKEKKKEKKKTEGNEGSCRKLSLLHMTVHS